MKMIANGIYLYIFEIKVLKFIKKNLVDCGALSKLNKIVVVTLMYFSENSSENS